MANLKIPTLSPDLEAEVVRLLAEKPSIYAMKRIYEATDCTVAEAYGWINQYFESRREKKPCPSCGWPLRTIHARQCFECGADWH